MHPNRTFPITHRHRQSVPALLQAQAVGASVATEAAAVSQQHQCGGHASSSGGHCVRPGKCAAGTGVQGMCLCVCACGVHLLCCQTQGPCSHRIVAHSSKHCPALRQYNIPNTLRSAAHLRRLRTVQMVLPVRRWRASAKRTACHLLMCTLRRTERGWSMCGQACKTAASPQLRYLRERRDEWLVGWLVGLKALLLRV